jgi:hypothetical protein
LKNFLNTTWKNTSLKLVVWSFCFGLILSPSLAWIAKNGYLWVKYKPFSNSLPLWQIIYEWRIIPKWRVERSDGEGWIIQWSGAECQPRPPSDSKRSPRQLHTWWHPQGGNHLISSCSFLWTLLFCVFYSAVQDRGCPKRSELGSGNARGAQQLHEEWGMWEHLEGGWIGDPLKTWNLKPQTWLGVRAIKPSG